MYRKADTETFLPSVPLEGTFRMGTIPERLATTRISSSTKERPWGPRRLDDSTSTQSVKSTRLPATETAISTSTTRILFLANPAMARRLLLGENFTSSVRPRLVRACLTSAEAVKSICMLMLRRRWKSSMCSPWYILSGPQSRGRRWENRAERQAHVGCPYGRAPLPAITAVLLDSKKCSSPDFKAVLGAAAG